MNPLRGTLAVAAREVRERRMVLPAAAICGVMALATPLLPGMQARDVFIGTLLVMAAFGCGLALGLGSEIVGGTLAARRMAFFFARPMGGAAIFLGRFLAALVLVGAVEALVALPGLLTSRYVRWAFASGDELLWLGVGSLLALGAGVGGGIVTRAKSKVLLLDVVALGLAILGGILVRDRLEALAERFQTHLERAFWSFAPGLAVCAVVVVAVASAVALTRGRTDAARVHVTFTKTLWPTVAAILLVLQVGAGVIGRMEPGRCVSTYGADPSGRFVSIGGCNDAWVVERQSGRWIEAAADLVPHRHIGTPQFSGDGSIATWAELDVDRNYHAVATNIVVLDTKRWTTRRFVVPKAAIPDPSVTWRESTVVLSQDASRVAFAAHEGVVFVNLATGDVVRAALPAVGNAYIEPEALVWTGPVNVRYVRGLLGGSENGVREIWDVSGVTGGAARGARFAGTVKSVARSLETLVTGRGSDQEHIYELRDGKTGAVIRELSRGRYRSIGYLDDGRIASVQRSGGKATITLFSRDGMIERSLDVDVPAWSVSGQLDQQTLILRILTSVWPGRVVTFDLETGALRQLPASLGQTSEFPFGPAARLLLDKEFRIWVLEPSGALRPAWERLE